MSIAFNKKDFEQVSYSFIFVNQTSGTEVRNYKQVKVNSIFEKGLVMTVPTSSCNLNHNLLVLIFKGNKPKIPKILPKEGQGKGIFFSAVGKVKEKNTSEEDKTVSSIKIDFIQFDKYGWEDIFNEYREKQESVTNTFNIIKVKEYIPNDNDED